MEDKFFKECFIQNIYHHKALEVWGKLKVGEKLSLKLSDDKDIVLLYKKYGEQKVIGELSDDDAKFIKDILEAGYEDVFTGLISYMSPEMPDENKRLKVVIKIKKQMQDKEQSKASIFSCPFLL